MDGTGDGDWRVRLDHDGRVIVDAGDDTVEGSYLVVPQSDGSLSVLALEHRRLAEGAPPEAPPAPVGPEDPDAVAAELARWGARALGDLRPGAQGPGTSASGRVLPLVEVRSEDRPQPAAIPSSDAAANAAALSAAHAAWRYWLVQNRDAYDLLHSRSPSGRRPAPGEGVNAPRSPG